MKREDLERMHHTYRQSEAQARNQAQESLRMADRYDGAAQSIELLIQELDANGQSNSSEPETAGEAESEVKADTKAAE